MNQLQTSSTPLPFAILFHNFRIIINMIYVYIGIAIITIIVYFDLYY